MVESRWRHRTRHVVLAVCGLSLAAASSTGPVGQAGPDWTPTACPGGPSAVLALARTPDPGGAGGRGPWWRIDPELDESFGLAGQRLEIGLVNGPERRTLRLPPESFAAGPFGGAVLAGSDDGSTTQLRVLDPLRGCAWHVAEEENVVRRATIDPTGRAVYEARVDRTTRGDLGIWRRDLAAGGPAVRVVAALPDDARFGRTFSTELTWDLERARLVVESCGAVACRVRTFDPATGSVALLDDPTIGPVVGVADGRVVAYGACRGLPCDIVAIDVWSGDTVALAVDAGLAALVRTDDGPRLVHERGAGPDAALAAVDLRGRSIGRIGSAPRGTRLVAGPAWSAAGMPAVDGWAAFAPGGRPTGAGSDLAVLRRIADGRTVRLDEVLR